MREEERWSKPAREPAVVLVGVTLADSSALKSRQPVIGLSPRSVL